MRHLPAVKMFPILSRGLATSSTETIRQFLKKTQNGFDRVLDKMNIVNCEDGKCLAEMKVEKEHTNPWDGLHGGMSATIVDIATTFALFTHKNAVMIPTVSVDMHLTYLKAVGVGEEIVIDALVLKAGKSMGYTTCEIRNKATGDIVVKGSHTKFMMRSK